MDWDHVYKPHCAAPGTYLFLSVIWEVTDGEHPETGNCTGCQFRWTLDSEFVFITCKLCDPRQFASCCNHLSTCGKLAQEPLRLFRFLVINDIILTYNLQTPFNVLWGVSRFLMRHSGDATWIFILLHYLGNNDLKKVCVHFVQLQFFHIFLIIVSKSPD